MHPDLERCKAILENENLTCVVKQGDKVLKTTDRGIKPFMQWIESGENLHGAVAADKVVGKAAAFLMEKAGISAVILSSVSMPSAKPSSMARFAFIHVSLSIRCEIRARESPVRSS